MNNRLIIICITVFAFVQTGFSQLTFLDSLKRELPKCKNASDSLPILCLLTWYSTDTTDAISIGKQALRIASRASDSSLIADAYDAAALSFSLSNEKVQAIWLYKKAKDIGVRNNFPLRAAWSSYNLAQMYLAEGNLKQVESFAHAGYRFFRQAQNPQMAFTSYWLLVKIKPFTYADSLRSMIAGHLPNVQNGSEKMFYYLDLTHLCNTLNNRNQAMYYVQLAMELAEKNKNTKGIVKAYSQIASYFSEVQHNYAQALTYYEKIAEQYNREKISDKGSIFIEIGEMHRLMGNTNKALSYFNKALRIAQGEKHRHSMASAYMKLGDVSYQQKNYTDALSFYLTCYNTNCDVCPRIAFHQALVNIGNVYLYSNNIANAKKYYQQSIEIADSAADNKAKSHSLQAFARLYEKLGDINKAVEYNQKAFGAAKAANALDEQLYNADKLSTLYAQLNDFRSAFRFRTEANTLKDSITRINEIDNLAKLETYFDFKNIQMQRLLDKTRSDQEIGRQKLVRNLSILGFLLITVAGIYILLGYRRKRKANTLLHEQNKAIENMAARVHTADQAKLEFYTNVSHELKTPLTLIIGMTEKLRCAVSEINTVHIIRKNALKLLQLVNHLLDLRKIDTSNMNLYVQESDLVSYLKGILSAFDNLFEQKQMHVDFQACDASISAFFDQDKMEKVFSNLLSNAVKYTNTGGSVKVGVSKRGNGYIEISVTDNGIGISEAETNNIFNRFYRVQGNNNQGSGIGLSLVKELVELHKGEIKVNSIKGVGSSFTVVVPIDKSYYSDKELSLPQEERSNWNYVDILDMDGDFEEVKDLSEVNSDDKTLLIVEDNSDLRKFIAGIFKSEYQVLEAADGLEALKISREFVPDIIISDIMMPNMSGIQLVDKLKSDVATSHIPIIMLTAKNDIATHVSSFDKGVDDFISKPFDSAILKSRVENLLRLRKQLVEKFSKQFKLQPREITIENADQKFIQTAIEIIEKNMSNPNLNVDLLALELGVSRTQLYRKLNALTDYPPKHFIRIIRLKRAAQILEQGQNNIAEVMDATGFSNYSYFNNCFKDFFGKYPKDYIVANVGGSMN